MATKRARSVTINDVAKAAGVSRAAVSKVIRDAPGVSPAMRERVERTIAELGYTPSAAARAMRGASYRIGLEIPHVSARFMGQVVDGAKSVLAGTRYQLMLAPADGPEYGAIESLADGLVDGIIAVSPSVTPEWLEHLALRVPIVMLGRHDDPVNYDSVVGDDDAGTRAAMAHLLELGHRRIAHLTESEYVTAPGNGTPHSVRLQVYREVMAEAGLGSFVTVARRGATEPSGRHATAGLFATDDAPTAIFAGHDDLAMQALAGISDAGLHPRDIAVVGYDNTDIAAHPLISLSTVDQRGNDMGAQAVTMILERIAGRTESRRYTVDPTLVVRSTSTGPRAGSPLPDEAPPAKSA